MGLERGSTLPSASRSKKGLTIAILFDSFGFRRRERVEESRWGAAVSVDAEAAMLYCIILQPYFGIPIWDQSCITFTRT